MRRSSSSPGANRRVSWTGTPMTHHGLEGDLRARNTSAGTLFQVRVVPRAGQSRITGIRQGALLVRLAAAPVDGKANAALTKLLAAAFGIPRHRVHIIAGTTSRNKRVEVGGLDVAELVTRLRSVLTGHARGNDVR